MRVVQTISMALLTTTTLSGAVFTNGSFEEPIRTPGAHVIADGSSLGAWQVVVPVGADVAVISGNTEGLAAEDGTQFVNFNGGAGTAGGAVQQDFDTLIGKSYVVSFRTGRLGPATGSISVRGVAISDPQGGATQIASLDASGPVAQGTWTRHYLGFTATTTTTRLRFTDTSSATKSVDVALDNVVVTRSEVIVGPIVSPINGHAYTLLTSDTWTNSQAKALSLGGNLVSINDAAEQEWVFDYFSRAGGSGRAIWIGLFRPSNSATFQWTSGEPVAYTHFAPGEPNTTEERFVYMLPTNGGTPLAGFWNDDYDRTISTYTGLQYVVPQFAIHGVVEFYPRSCPSDFFEDGLVNTIDLTVLLSGFGRSVTPFTHGDVTGDGLVDTRDLVIMLGDFGQSCL